MSEIKITLSRRKLLFGLICSILFVVLGIQFILKPERYISFVFRNIDFIRIAGFASLIFFGLCSIYILLKAFDKKPGLIIS